jgi:hypothetical protein
MAYVLIFRHGMGSDKAIPYLLYLSILFLIFFRNGKAQP